MPVPWILDGALAGSPSRSLNSPRGPARTLCGVTVRAWEADHASGAQALLLRLDLAGKTIAYTGDTAWTGAIAEAAADADLLIAEAYYRDKQIPTTCG